MNLLGGDLEIAHQQAQQSLDAITAELIALDLPEAGSDSGGSEFERATKEHGRLEEQSAVDKTTLESATKQRSDAEGDLKALETDAATLRGKLTVVDRPALESRLQKATGDPVLEVAEGPSLDWFRDQLRASAGKRGHQVIVFTCRPSDYLSPDWKADDSVAVVDLTVQLPRPMPL